MVAQTVKATACDAGDLGLIPGLGRSPGEGNGTPLQHSSLENSMDGGAWWATVHGVAKSRTRLSDFTFSVGYVCVCVQLYLILFNPMNCSPPGTPVHGILQARTPE